MVDKNAFFREHYAYAREAGLSDVQARLAVAQAAVETGWGTKGKAVKGNNFFGMKTGANWSGKSINLPTEEETQGGKHYTVNADFRQYANPVDAYRDWKSTMETNWPGVMQASTFNQAVAELDNGVKGRYATAKAYPASLKAVNVDLVKSGIPKQLDQQVATIPGGLGFALGDPAANTGPAGYAFGGLAPPNKVETSRAPAKTGGLLSVADVRGIPNASVLDTLHPAFQDRAKAFFAEAARRGIGIAPVAKSGGYRTTTQQAAINSTGVTSATPGRSYHNLGLGFDYAPVDSKNRPVWDEADPRWGQARALAEEMGMVQPIAGDLGHVQLANFPTKVPDALLGAPRFDVAGRSYPQLDPTAQLDVAGGYGPYAHHYEESLAAAPMGTVERAPLPDVGPAVANTGFAPGLMPAAARMQNLASSGGLFGSPSMMPPELGPANAGPAGRAYGDLVPPTQVETTSRPALIDAKPYTPDRQPAAIDYSPLSAGGVQRNQRPDESFMGGIGDAVAGYFGPGYSVSVASGKGVMRNPDGSVSRRGNHNHPLGLAADFDVIGPDGQQVGPARMADFGAYAASQGFTGIGVGPGYMEPGRMHLDVAHQSPTAWGAGGSSANMDPALHDAITQAGAFGAPVFGAGLPENVPTPESRPLPDTLMASAPDYQTVATKQVPVGDQSGVIGASYTPPQEDAPNPFSNEPAFSAPMSSGMIGSSIGQDFQPANVNRAAELASLAPSATGAFSPDLSGIRKALEATRTTAQNAVPQPGGTMFTMADAINAQPPAAPAPAPAMGSQLLNPEPLGTPELATPADFPAAPPEPTRMDRVKSRLPGAMKRATIMGAIGGPAAAAIGLASGLLGGENGMLGGLFDGPGELNKFDVGSIGKAMGGARGATGMSSTGIGYTSLGPNMGGLRTHANGDWQPLGADGSTTGDIRDKNGRTRGILDGIADAFGAGGGLMGDRPGGLGGLFGGLGLGGLFGGGEGNRGGFSRAERDKYGGRVGLW